MPSASHRSIRVSTRAILLVWALLATAPALGQGAASTLPALEVPRMTLDPLDPSVRSTDLATLSIEDLMNIEVTSVSKQKQRLGDSAAAIAVITQEDIHRSGATAIAELLRQAPGMHVAQLGPGQWAVGSRGFNKSRTNNLLVMMDGRTVYTPLFAGVYWDTVDYVLEDLERIEVVRGPGGTLWGSNAVNGVINVLSKNARDTQGLLFQEYYGNDGNIATARYGGNVDNRVFYRVYSKYRVMDDMPDPANARAIDGWDSLRSGFRIDANLTDSDTFTLQGDVFDNRAGHPRSHYSLLPPFVSEYSDITNTHGGNVLARYTHTFSDTSDLMVQLYYDKLQLTDHDNTFEQGTYDIEFQHRFALADRHEIIWGGGYRLVADEIDPLIATTALGDYANPRSRHTSLWSGFIQDDMTLVPGKLHAIVGTKLEMTPYTGFEFQPSARLLYTPDARNTFWASVSRAVRAPSRAENDARVLGGVVPLQPLPFAAAYVGNRDLKSEQLLALESGYRAEPVSNLSLDLVGFLNFHHGVVEALPSGAPGMGFSPVPHLVNAVSPQNAANGISYGAEVATRWKVSDQFTLAASYSYLCMSLTTDEGIQGSAPGTNTDRSSPSHQAQVRAYYDITRDLQVNAATYFVGTVENPHISSYLRTDLNVVWKMHKNAELQAGVRNLFDPQHPEFIDNEVRMTGNEVPRTFFVMVTGRF